jgi:molybdopterin converting factor small subunit
VRVLLYGGLRDALGGEALVESAEVCSVAELRDRLAADYPSAAAALRRSRAFVADRLVGDAHVPASGDVLEFLPPVSGG